jgi:hypothetical protein
MGGERGAGRPGCKFGMAHVRQLGLDARHVVMRRPVEYRRTLAGVKDVCQYLKPAVRYRG